MTLTYRGQQYAQNNAVSKNSVRSELVNRGQKVAR